ncbi:MAG: dihydrofolate reductase [Flavobacteriales bacterium]|nr:dihydrofolate reductase [Flavobacteriales bacterium]
MKLSIIVAISENGVIGHDNDLIWHLPADLKFFKETTTGHFIIMGRKTHESIGRPLPNRTNVVISRNEAYSNEGCENVTSIDTALELCKDEDEVFIIGGAQIYKESLAKVDYVYLTRVHDNFNGDVVFPEFDLNDWTEENSERHEADDKNQTAYSFIKYSRKS